MERYLPRLIEINIKEQLEIMGAIAIEGPKWVGKSTTGKLFAKKVVKLQNPIEYKKYQVYSTLDKDLLLEGDKPLMFDEWQKIPEIWDFIRLDVDDSGKRGEYILTGSAKPIDNINRHTGAGRIVKMKMRPMSLYEMEYSTGKVSLKDLFDRKPLPNANSKLHIKDLAELICRGGWPGSIDLPIEKAIMAVENYYNTLTSDDIVDIDQIRRNQTRAKIILKSFSRNISTLTSYQTMVKDVINHGEMISDESFYSYIRAFEKLYIIDNIPAWSPKLRSKSTIRSSDKRQLIDPSIAAVSLGAKPNDLINDMETFGFLFESLCSRDLAIYVESIGGKISHYRDSDQLEIDLILHLSDGKWGAVEVKTGLNEIDKASKNLLKLRDKIDEEKAPSFLMIITGSDYSYVTEEGIYVVPLGCLKP